MSTLALLSSGAPSPGNDLKGESSWRASTWSDPDRVVLTKAFANSIKAIEARCNGAAAMTSAAVRAEP
jgi:hypothetical protein